MEGRAGRWPGVGAEGGSDQRQEVPADAVVVVAASLGFGPVRAVRLVWSCLPLIAMTGGDVVGHDGGHGWYLSGVGWDLCIL